MIEDFQRILGALRELSRAELLTLDAAVRGLLSAPPPPVETSPPSDMPGPGSEYRKTPLGWLKISELASI